MDEEVELEYMKIYELVQKNPFSHACFFAATYMGAKKAIKNSGIQTNTKSISIAPGRSKLHNKYNTGSVIAEINIPRMAARLIYGQLRLLKWIPGIFIRIMP